MAQNTINAVEKKAVNFTEALSEIDPQTALVDSTALRVNDAVRNVIDSHTPHGESLKGRDVTVGFPNVGFELMQLGLAVEKHKNGQILAHLEEVEKHNQNIELLLKLNDQLTPLKKEDLKELPDNIKTTLNELKEKGIDLWAKVETSITKEQIATLKSQSQNHIGKQRSEADLIFTTKISTLQQMLTAILDSVKEIGKHSNRTNDRAVSNQVRH